MAKLLTTKRALIILLFLAIVLVAVYSFLLDQKASAIHLPDIVLRSESGRLVARSQLDFHHIVEQWVQPAGKKNHSARRKERLIEDGRVIKEAFDYGESENENADDFQQSKLNFHLDRLANISSRHNNNEKQLHREFGLAHSKNLSKNRSSTSSAQGKQHWLQPEDIKQPQSSLLQSNHNEPIMHDQNGTKSIKVNSNFGDVKGHSETAAKSHNFDTQNVEFANLHVQRSNDHGDSRSKQAGGGVDAQANLQPPSESRMKSGVADQSLGGETKGAVMETELKRGSSLSESKVKSDLGNPPHELVPVRSDHANTALDAQEKHGVLPEKPDLQAAVDTQVENGEESLSESKSKPVISDSRAQMNVRPGSEVEAGNGHIPVRHRVLSYKPDAVNRDERMPLGSEQESTRHEQLSKLKRDIRAQVPVALDAGDTQAAAHKPDSELKTISGAAKQAPIKKTDQTLAKSALKTEGATANKHVQKVKPGVTSKNASKNYLVYRPPPKSKTKLKSADSSSASEKTRVMYVNSHGHTIRVVKRQNNPASPKTGSTQQQQQKSKYETVKQANNKARVHPAPSLVMNASSSYSIPKASELNQENFDFDSDPRYAHLPAAVKKKLAEIRKNRLSRIKFIRLIRKRCEGKKYCVQHVKSTERGLHDNCFYDAIMAEEKDGTELNPCHCSLKYSIGRGATSHLSHGVVSSSEVYNILPLVALVSLPGSGNTWVRGLLEEATGYCTGSMWCDPVLRAKQFCAEGIRSNTLVVKNHDANIRWLDEKLQANMSNLAKPAFSSAIFVHRNPYEATIAEWNRALGFKVYNATKHNTTVAGIGYYNSTAVKDQHTVTFGKEAFGKNPGWNWTIYQQMENWEEMINHLLINKSDSNPVLLVKYEDLKNDPYQEVERMLMFLDVKVKEDVRNRLKSGFHAFHRNHTYTFDHYTVEQKIYVNEVINRVSKQLQYHNVDYLHLHKYLRD